MFFGLQDKTWIKMPKWTIFLISSKVFVLITEIFWRNFWRCKRLQLLLCFLNVHSAYFKPALWVAIYFGKKERETTLYRSCLPNSRSDVTFFCRHVSSSPSFWTWISAPKTGLLLSSFEWVDIHLVENVHGTHFFSKIILTYWEKKLF